VRLPDAVWSALERIAATRGVSTHALMREALVRYVLYARSKPRAKAPASRRSRAAARASTSERH
jgi:predicted transcriptional regulator